MKKWIFGLALALVASVALAVIGVPGTTGVRLTLTYPSAELSTNLIFRVYSTTNITDPQTSWPLFTTWVGTNTTSPVVPMIPEQRFFICTASNTFWKLESVFSNVASTPPAPRSDVTIIIAPAP